MRVESISKNKTWDVVPLPKGRKATGWRWVFCVKKNQGDEIQRFEARVVAKKNLQKCGIKYDETFIPAV